MRDPWSTAQAYEPYVGRWSRLAARKFLAWLAASPGQRWLDVGCGTGALCEALWERAAPSATTGIDLSLAYAGFAAAQARGKTAGLTPRPSRGRRAGFAARQARTPAAGFAVGSAQALPVKTGSFDGAVSGLVLNFLPDPARGVAEMARAVRPDGVVAVYVWDYAGEMQLMRCFWDAAMSLDAGALELDEGRRFPTCRPEPLAGLFRDAGLRRVEVRAIDVPTAFRDFDDYWSPFLGGQGPAPGYAMSLSEERRVRLRERLRETLPTRSDGSIHLIARAWAARGWR